MKYLKYTPYIYLIAGIIFGFEAIQSWEVDQNKSYIFIGIALLSIGMFFFRLHFAKKYLDRKNQHQ